MVLHLFFGASCIYCRFKIKNIFQQKFVYCYYFYLVNQQQGVLLMLLAEDLWSYTDLPVRLIFFQIFTFPFFLKHEAITISFSNNNLFLRSHMSLNCLHKFIESLVWRFFWRNKISDLGLCFFACYAYKKCFHRKSIFFLIFYLQSANCFKSLSWPPSFPFKRHATPLF